MAHSCIKHTWGGWGWWALVACRVGKGLDNAKVIMERPNTSSGAGGDGLIVNRFDGISLPNQDPWVLPIRNGIGSHRSAVKWLKTDRPLGFRSRVDVIPRPPPPPPNPPADKICSKHESIFLFNLRPLMPLFFYSRLLFPP